MPAWIEKILENMGVAGAIIFVLLGTIAGLVAYVKSLQGKADKVYGYRLNERDTLNKALTDTAKVLGDMLKATEDRNDLTEEQAELINKQSQAFELLKITILAQYENIDRNNHAVALSVTAMAEAIRVLTSMVNDQRMIVANQVTEVKQAVAQSTADIREFIRVANQSQIVELRNIMGAEVTTVRRRGGSAPK